MSLTFSSYKKLTTGTHAPLFNLKGIDGKSHKLEDIKGAKATLVIFMCNHCPYVVPKMEYFVQLQNKYGKDGLQIVGINSNDPVTHPEDNFEKMKEYARNRKFNFYYLIDETQEIARSYGAECTPDPYLFDSQLKLKYHGRFDEAQGRPHQSSKTSEMEDAIKSVLSGSEVTVQSLPSCGCNIKWKS